MTETVLDDQINAVLPPSDPTGNVAYAATFRYHRALQGASAILFAGLLGSVAVNVWQSHRPPVVLVVRVDEAGRAAALHYDALHFTPREAEIRARLNDWATYRFGLLKAVAGSHFALNYDYLTAALARRLMVEDSPRLAKILAGNEPEQDVTVDDIRFRSLDGSGLSDGAVASGEAVIDLTKIVDPSGSAERQRWTITVKYEVNPVQAAKRGERDPQFLNVNPLGVIITWFHEDRSFR